MYGFVYDYIDGLRKDGQYRRLRPGSGVDFSSNDFLGLASDPSLVQAVQKGVQAWGVGSRASRLVHAQTEYIQQTECSLAVFARKESALLFSTGYMTNLGVISALACTGVTFVIDRLCHASIYDGLQLSSARYKRYAHADMRSLEKRLRASEGERMVICTESIFSMDGDRAPLPEISALARKYNALLLVDEAHALGMYGATGAGLAQEMGVLQDVDIYIGTLGKGAGCAGGFVASADILRELFINKARSFIYTTAPMVSQVVAAEASIELVSTLAERAQAVRKKADLLRRILSSQDTGNSTSHIIPVIIGDAATAMELSHIIEEKGFVVRAIRPPTVPPGTARLRIVMHHFNTEEEIYRLGEIINDFLA